MSGVRGLKGQAEPSARLDERGGLAGFGTLRGLFSRRRRLVSPALACVSDEVQDGCEDHLSICPGAFRQCGGAEEPRSRVVAGGRQGGRGGGVQTRRVEGSWGRPLGDPRSTRLTHNPTEGELEVGVDRGMDGKACRGRGEGRRNWSRS